MSKSAYNFVALRVTDLTVSGVAYNDLGVEIDRFTITAARRATAGRRRWRDDAKDDGMDPLPKMAGEGGCSFLGFGAGAGMQRTSTGLALLGSLGVLLCGAFLRRRQRQGLRGGRATETIGLYARVRQKVDSLPTWWYEYPHVRRCRKTEERSPPPGVWPDASPS